QRYGAGRSGGVGRGETDGRFVLLDQPLPHAAELPRGTLADMRTLEERRAALKRRGALPELDRRREATQATLDKFRDTAFDWAEGRHCVRMAAYHLRQMGWRSPKLPTIPRVRSALAAKKELQAH